MRTLIILLTFFSFSFANAQRTVIKLDSNPGIFTVDKVGSIYVYQNRILEKYTARGKLTAQYSTYRNGEIYAIDASDPFRLLLFYKDFNQLQFLDNKLNQIGNPIKLEEIGFNYVACVCKSSQTAFWLYDEYENKLYLYDLNRKSIINTINLNNFNEIEGHITYMLEQGNKLFLLVNNKTIWVLDQYGFNEKQITTPKIDFFQIYNETVFYNNGKNIFFINLLKQQSHINELQFPFEFENALVSSENYYFFNADSIVIFKRSFQKHKSELKDSTMQYISEIFISKPGQWGLRGDPYLWEELKLKFTDSLMNISPDEFDKKIDYEFFELLKNEGEQKSDEIYWFDKFPKSGMSGGMVSLKWWKEIGLPLLKKRYHTTFLNKK